MNYTVKTRSGVRALRTPLNSRILPGAARRKMLDRPADDHLGCPDMARWGATVNNALKAKFDGLILCQILKTLQDATDKLGWRFLG